MRLADIEENRIQLERIQRETTARERRKILENLGSLTPSLLLWHFGRSTARRSPDEIPLMKLRLFWRLYGQKAA